MTTSADSGDPSTPGKSPTLQVECWVPRGELKRTADSTWVSNPEKAKASSEAGIPKPGTKIQEQEEEESGAFYQLSNIILLTTFQGSFTGLGR